MKPAQLKSITLVLVLLGGAFSLGRCTQESEPHSGSQSAEIETEEQSSWTCSMHPQVNLPEMGACPICFMDLIPLEEGQALPPQQIEISPEAVALAEVETMEVKRQSAQVKVDLVGKLGPDLTYISEVNLLSDAQIRTLHIQYDGIPLREGDHLAELYSPEVFNAGQDLLLALERSGEQSPLSRSALRRLKLLGVPDSYVESIRTHKKVPETYTLRSPRRGFVDQLQGHTGMWLKKGQRLCRIVDTHHLWARLEAYEKDLPFLHYGQTVHISTDAMPGLRFEGQVSYIAPTLDDRTRTTLVRVNLSNDGHDLKPGLLVRAQLHVDIDERGHGHPPILQGRWISPMHPEIIKDGPGQCDICGMDLVPLESNRTSTEFPMLVPRTSLLMTGRRALVYVQKPGPLFEGRVVDLGPVVGDQVVILSGLQEGELVVAKGAFKIDSSMQILAKPSMMSQIQEREALQAPTLSPLGVELESLVKTYLDLQEALSSDREEALSELLQQLEASLELSPHLLYQASSENLRLHRELSDLAGPIFSVDGMEAIREQLKAFSVKLIQLVQSTGHSGAELHHMYCSMADGHWLQRSPELANPYYGSSMLRCGTLEATLQPRQP